MIMDAGEAREMVDIWRSSDHFREGKQAHRLQCKKAGASSVYNHDHSES
jgi:hypothetical protein